MAIKQLMHLFFLLTSKMSTQKVMPCSASICFKKVSSVAMCSHWLIMFILREFLICIITGDFLTYCCTHSGKRLYSMRLHFRICAHFNFYTNHLEVLVVIWPDDLWTLLGRYYVCSLKAVSLYAKQISLSPFWILVELNVIWNVYIFTHFHSV